MTTKATHGGQRENAGRKTINPAEPTVRVTVRLSQSQADWLSRQGNVSDTVRQIITDAMNLSQPVKR